MCPPARNFVVASRILVIGMSSPAAAAASYLPARRRDCRPARRGPGKTWIMPAEPEKPVVGQFGDFASSVTVKLNLYRIF
jgi:hypothetical protein